MTPKEQFSHFLEQYFPKEAQALLTQFELYLEVLYETNQKVNLVSRQMSREDYWLYHFLDSLLIFNCMDLKGGKALDFGSGGGLPGIPIKLVRPDIKLTLLDSVGKKVKCLEQIVSTLKLNECTAIWSRLEDFVKSRPGDRFDYILCRSVRLEAGFIEPLSKLLKPAGKAVFYKANRIDDVSVLPDLEIYDVSMPLLGTRQIVIAPGWSFAEYLKNKKVG